MGNNHGDTYTLHEISYAAVSAILLCTTMTIFRVDIRLGRTENSSGSPVSGTPGWACHQLPICRVGDCVESSWEDGKIIRGSTSVLPSVLRCRPDKRGANQRTVRSRSLQVNRLLPPACFFLCVAELSSFITVPCSPHRWAVSSVRRYAPGCLSSASPC